MFYIFRKCHFTVTVRFRRCSVTCEHQSSPLAFGNVSQKIRVDGQDFVVQSVFSTPCIRRCSSVSASMLYLTNGCHHVQHWYLTPRRWWFPPVYIYLQKSTKCTQSVIYTFVVVLKQWHSYV